LTVGFGGSAGLEAPIVITGAAIGSNFASSRRLSCKDRMLLLAAGSSAGIAAIFNAPIAGVMFSIEVLLLDATAAEMVPLIIAAVSGALVSKVVLQENILLAFNFKQVFSYYNVPYYIVLGILSGLMSLYYARVFRWIEGIAERMREWPYTRAAIGGIVLVALGWAFPSILGEGYSSVKFLAQGANGAIFSQGIFQNVSDSSILLIALLILIPLIKVPATAITIGFGGNGGNFGPSLFVGSFLGNAFATLINHFHFSDLPTSNFTIVGMAGILSGVMYAPLTGIFLIAEITGGYELIIPLMIVSSISYIISRHFDAFSMETRKAALRGHIFTDNTDQNVLLLLRVESIVERDVPVISPHASLRSIVQIVKNSRRNIFAIVNEDRELVGVISFDDMREVMFQTELYDTIIAFDLMRPPPAIIQLTDDMRDVMRKFESTHSWNLPVIDGIVFIGVVSKSAMLDAYREMLVEHTGADPTVNAME
jgi:chloride channel protein, CIC family